MTLYKKIDNPQEGELVQYLGVYVTKWNPTMGEPDIGFVEVENDKIERLKTQNRQLIELLEMFDAGSANENFKIGGGMSLGQFRQRLNQIIGENKE